jgi:hypothetical protein
MKGQLKPSADRKVWAYKNQKNTFGLLPGPEGTCPGATLGPGGCRTVISTGGAKGRPDCYVYRMMSIYKGVRGVLEHNTDLLMNATHEEQVTLLNEEFKRFKQVHKNGSMCADKYRLHWSGDIFDRQYAESIRAALITNQDIQFWTYTRTFDVIDVFKDVDNLRLYLSLDACNVDEGLKVYENEKWDKLHLCYMGDNPPDLEESFVGCPVDSGQLALEGACQSCKLCLRGHNIWFKTKR